MSELKKPPLPTRKAPKKAAPPVRKPPKAATLAAKAGPSLEEAIAVVRGHGFGLTEVDVALDAQPLQIVLASSSRTLGVESDGKALATLTAGPVEIETNRLYDATYHLVERLKVLRERLGPVLNVPPTDAGKGEDRPYAGCQVAEGIAGNTDRVNGAIGDINTLLDQLQL